MDWKDAIGYVGSALVLISLPRSSVARLRLVNMCGALVFAFYGWLVGAWPVLILNTLTASVNIIHLIRLNRLESSFELLEIARADNRYLQRVLEYHSKDISGFFPNFDASCLEGTDIVFILRDMQPAGLVACRPEGDAMIIEIDYVVPRYRDFRCARFYFNEHGARYAQQDYHSFVTRAGSDRHEAYLRRLGFKNDGDRYRRVIPHST